MPREVVTVQVGQCGNQIGSAFWAAALREHAAANPDGLYDDAMSSFFQNVDTRFQPPMYAMVHRLPAAAPPRPLPV
jgi:tubulin epsilon